MNKSLRRRIENLESQAEPVWIPLRLICPVMNPRELEPGERIVSDELVDDPDEARPLMINVQERITRDPNDHGSVWRPGGLQPDHRDNQSGREPLFLARQERDGALASGWKSGQEVRCGA